MEEIKRRYIDWHKTGRILRDLRNDNLNLRRYVCYVLKSHEGNCSGECESCKYEMDNSISRAELAQVFNVSDSIICNWESGKTPVGLDDLLFYCEITGLKINDIIDFAN